jgi:hypothetical protein
MNIKFIISYYHYYMLMMNSKRVSRLCICIKKSRVEKEKKLKNKIATLKNISSMLSLKYLSSHLFYYNIAVLH